VGIDASELMPDPLGPRNRDHGRASVLLLGVASKGVLAVGVVSGSEPSATSVTDSGRVPAPFCRARGPRPGPSKAGVKSPTARSKIGSTSSSQKPLRCLLLDSRAWGESLASGMEECMVLDSEVFRRVKGIQPAWEHKVSVSTHKSR
jgi:hypothetical protein